MNKCMKLLALAASAIRDHLAGYRDEEVAGVGMKVLLRDIVTYLRQNGVDDEGGWDCEATDNIEIEQVSEFEPFKLVVEAYALDEFGDSPAWAEITVTPSFMAQIKRLQRLCEDEKIDSVTILDAPSAWEREDDFNIRGNQLRVMKDCFWYEAYLKNSTCDIETRSIDINRLQQLAYRLCNLDFYERNGVYFHDASDASDLAEMYFESKLNRE